ncbi:MAG: hypothetical protein ACFFCQ_18910 [Promethearchaeota archaeon]
MAHNIGSIVGALGVVFGLIIFHRLLRNYRITGRTESLFLAGFWGCLGIAVLLVGLEQAVFEIMDKNDAKDIATFFAILAFSFAINAFFLGHLFALSFFSKEKLKLVIVPGILLLIYLGYWLLTIHYNGSGVPDPHYGPWHDTGVDFDMYRTGSEKVILFVLMFIPVWFIVGVLGYATIKLKDRPPLFKRSLLLTILQAIINIQYIIEILGTDFIEPLLGDLAVWMIVLGRINYVFVPLAIYFVYVMPQWLKNLIGEQ